MSAAISFALPSLHTHGHVLAHDGGVVTLTFAVAPRMLVSTTLSSMTPSEARTIAAALTEAANQAEAAKTTKVAP